ncbi:hypothetical protein SERLA73DRAFT_122218 [Serpula lacrymans var. lacrymans S7.3]|uniref:Uncharacterized protein n=1 Tax=Serpula lacrymans var. lacrymans (strain S7.3) TaxID=936435 RepID=F8PVD2_SERL3|nr:hypothetical protein SERLA73DRAFT_122218 [Serpula lacrymans var. lacrymans S7.3]
MPGGPLTIKWMSECTDRLLDWLEQNVQKRHLLFSNSQEDANKESRKKGQAKSSKVTIHGEIAQFVFSGDRDPVICSTLKANPGRFAKAVDNHIASKNTVNLVQHWVILELVSLLTN